MKKTLIIALCCLSVLFTACNKEKPYEKFIGDWYGNGIVKGTMTMNIPSIPGGSMDHNLDNIAIPMSIKLSAGEAKNEVILTYTNDEVNETYTTKGVINGNDVDFEPVNINMTVEATTIHATLDLMGTLNERDDILALNGTLSGNGTVGDGGVSIPFTATGTVTANLNRGIAPEPDPTPDPIDPTLTLKTDEGYLSEGDVIETGNPIIVGLMCQADKLKTMLVVFTSGETIILEESTDLPEIASSSFIHRYFLTQEGDITMTATLTDTQGKTATVTVNFKSIDAPVPAFEAHYQGLVNLDATAASMMFTYPINVDYDMDIMISETNVEGQVNATIIFAGNSYTTTGTKEDNVIDLEPFDVVIDYDGSTVNATIDINGTIGEDILSVQGNLNGSGNITIPDMPIAIPATIEGTLAGDLNKVE